MQLPQLLANYLLVRENLRGLSENLKNKIQTLDSWNADTVDSSNENKRTESRPIKLFGLYQSPSESEMIERRLMADEPMENIKHRIFVQCNKLELNLQIEPIFASMALYDAKEKKKVSENFYFDMNSESLKSMLASHTEHKHVEYTTQAR